MTSLLAVALTACVRQAPQRPSTRLGQAPEPDTAQLALMEFNRRMAAAADDEVTRYAQATGQAYALYDNCTWMWVYDRGNEDEPVIREKDRTQLHLRVYDLSEKLMADIERQYTVGHMELPPAVESNIIYLHPRAKARLIAPWYTAYGTTGTEGVPPYTNVIIDLEIQ